MKMTTRIWMACWFLATTTIWAAVKPHALISDGMVLQQGEPAPVWGTANDGENVTVKFAGQIVTTTAKAGRWLVRLSPLKASATPQTMTITGENTVTINDVLIGEVWLCSGQSNMAWPLGNVTDSAKHIAAANDPLLRLFTVPRGGKAEPQRDVEASWSACTSANAPSFSAVGYFFGRDLRKARGVPVGLINSSVGGTAAEKWTSREALAAEPSLRHLLDEQAQDIVNYPAAVEQFKKDEPQLLANWKAAVERAKAEGKQPPRKPGPPQDPATSGLATLYNAMIAPLQPFAIAGVIWYQGEANAGRAKAYQTLFPTMINSWRVAWNRPALPFLFVQIAPFHGQPPEIREAQLLSWKKVPQTAMVVITDYGDAQDIHPKQKEPVGARLALAARAVAYGEKIEYSGPVYESFKVKGREAIVSFSHSGGGLVAKGGGLKGFTISGGGTNFVPAQATIRGETVVVSSSEVAQPVAVRYGWANVPEVNLFNKRDLPASPFRTDVK